MSKNNKDFFKCKNSWSEIKDRLLSCYLPQYFQKVLWTKKPIFYVDCFAGKGRFDDGKDGSPRIALKIRDQSLSATKVDFARIDACFIDLNYAKELKENTAEFHNDNGSVQVVSGRYEEQIEHILSEKRNTNIFLYIDPYGIKALDSKLFDKFSKIGSIEMLINMNSFGFFRDACRVLQAERVQRDEVFQDLNDIVEYDPTDIDTSDKSKKLLTNIAGGDYWVNIVRDYQANEIDGYEAEKRFSMSYKQYLSQKYSYVLDMPIRMKVGQRPKYRMIHVCNHEDGCILMAENMASRSDELYTEVQNQGQLSMFNYDTENEVIDVESIRNKMLSILLNFPNGVTANKLKAAFYTQFGVLCKMSTIHNIWGDLEKSGIVEVTRYPAHTEQGRPTKFFNESTRKGKEQHVIIRRSSL